MNELCYKMTIAMKPRIMNLRKITLDHHDKKNLLIKTTIFMVLKHQRSKSIQNFKFYDSSTFKQNVSNNTNTHTNTSICNATSNVTLNNNPDYRIRDHSNNTRTLTL